MRRIGLLALLAVTTLPSCGGEGAGQPAPGSDQNALRFTLPRLNGKPDDLSRYGGKVVLVVNTASECGFTPQFEGLEALWRERRDEGLVVLGFPANDFAGQEPRSNREIGEFCRANFGVSFPMFAKLKVTGEDAHPLFQALGEPDWNFNKYLLNRRGRLVERWGGHTARRSRALPRNRRASELSAPGAQVLELIGCQLVDLHPERLELEAGDLFVDRDRHVEHAVLELVPVPGQMLHRQGEIREAHVHHRGRVPLAGGQIHDAALSQQVEASAVAEHILLDQRQHLPHLTTGQLT